jgi:PAS domain S-box-containing protein
MRNLKLKNDQISELIAMCRQIGDNTKQGLLKRQSEILLILESAKDGYWEKHLPSGSIFWSPRCYEMLGYRLNDFQPTKEFYKSIIHPDDWNIIQKAIDILSKDTTACISIEYRIKSKSGEYRWIREKGKVSEVDQDGYPIRIIGIHTDITEKKYLEKELWESRTRLQAAINNLPYDFWMLDTEGRYILQNAKCIQNWGDVIGKRTEEVSTDPHNLAIWQNNNRRAFSGETVEAEVQLCINGELRHFFNVISPIHDGPNLIGVLGLNVDITQIKEVEAVLEKRNQELSLVNSHLQTLHHAKDEFISMISHELRTPLVTGLGYIGMILEGAYGTVSDKISSRLKIAQKNLKRLSGLIDGMLKYHSLLDHERPIILPFNIRELAQEALSEFLFRSKIASNRVHLKVADNTPLVLADVEMIRRVFANLLDNAAYHAGIHAQIQVFIEPGSDNKVHISVIDTGVGIPAELKSRVFEPFVKSVDSKTGYGLGLAFIHAILKSHDAQVVLESEEGQGTKVTFSLPAVVS